MVATRLTRKLVVFLETSDEKDIDFQCFFGYSNCVPCVSSLHFSLRNMCSFRRLGGGNKYGELSEWSKVRNSKFRVGDEPT